MANGKVTFVLGIHNHQPLGNFDNVFDEAYRKAYLPFLERVERHPGIRINLHNTGILLDWFEEHYPEMIDRLRALVTQGRMEPISGGYYEPIMPPLPDRDKIGQIEKLNQRIESLFDFAPGGMWLAERVWEPHLAKPLAQAGVKYVVMDDSHFKAAGLRGAELFGYYRTEEQGHSIATFPIDEQLRYLIPFQEVERTIDYLRRLAESEEDCVVVMADDGEKFGIWPKTYHSVYEQGWLDRFFEALERNGDWIQMKLFHEVLEERQALGNVYIPSASYTEMMEWALPPDRTAELDELIHRPESEPFRLYMRGGSWRSYFSKYEESNSMHKRMLYISQRVDDAPKARRETALDALWRAQCNCAYWHGVFGGLYLNHLRTEVYRNLIDAEAQIEAGKRGKRWIETDVLDLLCNGGQCAVIRSREITLCIDAAAGGSIFELDFKPLRFNVLNTMTRRPEAYHRKLAQAVVEGAGSPAGDGAASIHDVVLAKEAGLQDKLHYDWYRRTAMIDHFMPLDADLNGFAAARQRELADTPMAQYEMEVEQEEEGEVLVRLRREDALRAPDGNAVEGTTFRLTKTLRHEGGSSEIEVRYQIENTGERPIDARFGVEWGFSLQAGHTPDRYYCIPDVDLGHDNKLGSIGSLEGVPGVKLVEEWIGLEIDLAWERPATLWRCPVETISNSEGGFERSYQSSAVMPHWRLQLASGERWETAFVLRLARR